jgi:acyl CoA:acetate/3-ketoacid CoA transferase
VRIIRDGDTIATGGFVGTGFPEQVAIALESYFLETNRPVTSRWCMPPARETARTGG